MLLSMYYVRYTYFQNKYMQNLVNKKLTNASTQFTTYGIVGLPLVSVIKVLRISWSVS
ncbi:hypothetical protein VCRA2122O265_90033 [Vibrio crassostreae]|nr:hypothetical protein VCRA2110O178_100004 [Vibrio crassostreae]CAK1706283.1 hypothetical protein VCRA2113O204_100146 [Vibrio crassostreae]CAK1708042.1 hypothetical protein VCRA2113O201_100146 [Vibrio crassostreae]CAK1711175.1 hypothetical protein VCRA2113O228_100181 [Vibrio crassostreae]CAK1745594.1 hypothetical protein VCRA2113O196_120146 [Vibrio crassostreae]